MATQKRSTSTAGLRPSPTIPTFYEALALSDCVAQRFPSLYPSKQASPSLRAYLRTLVTPGIRLLWRTGDAETRTTLAARIHVWLDRNESERNATLDRIRSRERARFSEGGAR